MGQTLSEPVTAKETSSCENEMVKVGSSCMQGWRINMEDAHTHLLSMPDDNDACFFAVYDGHGGAKIAHYAGTNLHKKIAEMPDYADGNISEAMRKAFLVIDQDMLRDEELKHELAGTTAAALLIKNDVLYCANVGDSRVIISSGGIAQPLSYDHKPANELETKRIVAAGGFVEFNRVNGNLALSRALGDFVFKRNAEKSAEEQIVTAQPDIIVRELVPEDEFIVLACDGIWDVLSNQEVADFCRDRLASKMGPEDICEELLNRCLAPDCQMGGLGCDNMTVILVCMLRGASWDEYCAKCARPRPPTPPMMDEYSPPPQGGMPTMETNPAVARATEPNPPSPKVQRQSNEPVHPTVHTSTPAVSIPQSGGGEVTGPVSSWPPKSTPPSRQPAAGHEEEDDKPPSSFNADTSPERSTGSSAEVTKPAGQTAPAPGSASPDTPTKVLENSGSGTLL